MPEISMVNGQILPIGVTDRNLIAAMLAVPRDRFVPPALTFVAHMDTDLRLKASFGPSPPRFLMAPGPFAKLLQAARVRSADSVLDVGCATGYSSAVIARLGAFVTALESDCEFAALAIDNLASLYIDNVEVVTGPLELGWPSNGPYDVIFLGGSVEQVPDALVTQLKQHGRLVAIVESAGSSTARLYIKSGSALGSRELFSALTKPLPGFLAAKVFNFY